MIIEKIDKQVLLDIIELGKYEVKVNIANTSIYFNLANVGNEAQAELYVVRKEGFDHQQLKKNAILATNICKIGAIDFEEKSSEHEKFEAKYEWINKLQQPVKEFLWDCYLSFRIAQDARLKEMLENAKKSLPSQDQ